MAPIIDGLSSRNTYAHVADDDDSSLSLDSLPSSTDETGLASKVSEHCTWYTLKAPIKRYKQIPLEDIAVVGMACRLPGENDSPEKLWKSILEKQVACGEIPSLRWEPYYRRDPRNAKVI